MSPEKFSASAPENRTEWFSEGYESPIVDVESAYDEREAMLDLFEADLRINPHLAERPDEWFDTLLTRVESAIEEPEDVLRYFHLQKRESRIMEELDKRKYPDEEPAFPLREGDDIKCLLYNIPLEKVKKAFVVEAQDGILHTEVLKALEDKGVLAMLQVAYGVDSAKELISVTGGEFEKKLKKSLLEPEMLPSLKFLEGVGSDRESNRVWMREICSRALNISEEDADAYVFSASADFSAVGPVLDIIGKVEHFGIERVKALSEATGIKGLEGYTIEQLERMERFAAESESVAEELAERDVNILMVNRSGDHNGVMLEVAGRVDDESSSSRTLFFEIDSANDVYRYFSKLKKAGITPSTLVLAAHGSKGRIIISDERNPEMAKDDLVGIDDRGYMRHLDETNPVTGRRRLSIDGMSGFARIVEDYMQESRGFDDIDQDIGRKKIVFISCEAAVDTDLHTIDAQQGEVKAVESLVSQLGKDLQQSGVSSSIDIYGASDSIQVSRTEHGLEYTGQPGMENGHYKLSEGYTYTRSKLHAVKVSLESGNMTERDVDEVILRK